MADDRPVTNHVEFIVNGVRIRHEFCDTTRGFSHRVAIGNTYGEWQSYQGMAEVEIASTKRTFYGVTDYYSGMPEVFEVIAGVKEG